MIDSKDIVYTDIIGLPFKDGGTGTCGKNPGGFDCYNLMVEVFRRFGVIIPQTNISVLACASASQKEIDAHKARSWKRIKYPIEPCAVQIFSSDKDFANHLATYIGNGKIIHITMRTNTLIQRLSTISKHKIEGFYKYVNPNN